MSVCSSGIHAAKAHVVLTTLKALCIHKNDEPVSVYIAQHLAYALWTFHALQNIAQLCYMINAVIV
jgi:hypothetical protein